MHHDVRVAVACANTLGESAVWSVHEQVLYWVDIRGHALHCYSPSRQRHDCWTFQGKCCGVALLRDGVVVGVENSIFTFDRDSQKITLLVEVESKDRDNRLNEMRCDRNGRLWVGTMRDFGAAVTGSLYRIDPDLTVHKILSDIRTPNSLAWSPDGTRMYFADSGEGLIRSYSFDAGAGVPGSMQTFFGRDAATGNPDGSCVDSEGCVWNARVRAGQIARLSPQGELVEVIGLPALLPTSVVFGGDDLRTLFVTTARQGMAEEHIKRWPASGHLLEIETNVRGLPEPMFEMRP